MLFFPQLDSLAVAQFPLERKQIFRTVLSRPEGGQALRYSDAGARRIEWRLSLDGLTDTERARVDNLFASTKGSLATFTFLDPFENLLAYSEDLAAPPWTNSGGLATQANIQDPLGTHRATAIANAGQFSGRFSQHLPLPASFHYCLSAYVRSTSPTSCELILGEPTAPASRMVDVASNWTRVAHRAGGQSGTQLTAGFELLPGDTIEVFGAQLEAQIAPSAYRKTLGKTGIRPNSRFLTDTLNWTTSGPNLHNTLIEIESY